ncbi:Serine/threonine-protein phosphatase PP-Z [Fusarium oxysporum f. sp. albedinis]|nr:Serine/threonine-protein phosphatase PP-Z [Fusarium oxysporum f. sp. albedinis]
MPPLQILQQLTSPASLLIANFSLGLHSKYLHSLQILDLGGLRLRRASIGTSCVVVEYDATNVNTTKPIISGLHLRPCDG